MADYTFLRMLAGLRIVDTPVSYSPPRGPFVDLTLTYNQREVFQPSVFPYVNVGRKWTFDPISYVEDDPAGGLQTIRLYRRGGGMEVYPDMPPGAGVQSAPHFQSRAILARTNTSPVVYRRRAPDGTVEFFQQADGALSFPRKFLLTQIRDPQENVVRYVYDNFLRLVAITDAIGQVTTLSYADESLTITRITDPFGRSATLTYDGEGRLSSITDVLGLTSSFTYGTADFITSMTTPYGTTRFSTGDTFVRRWIEAEDPLGGRERAEYVRPHDSTVGPRWLPAEEIPQAFQADPTSVPPFDGVNGNWDAGLTLFWDKRAMLLAPGLVSSAEITHWLESVPSHRPNGVMRAYKRPLESRVFYRFAGQSTSHANDGRPIAIGRFVHDGTSPPATPVTQLHQYGYNSRGKFIRYVDPSLRETRYTYGSESTPDPDQANGAGIDLLKVEQKNPAGPSGYDLLESTTYDANHRPLTVTDTSGQTTVYTYLPDGRLSTVVTPVRNGPNGVPLTVAERTTTYAYYPDGAPTGAGRVHTVTGPTTAQGSPLTTFTYDGYGRVRTTADVDNYTLTLDYDASDRLTRTTYPDGTYEETTYNKLDAEESRDRGGKRSYTIHDALRRVVAQRDAAGRTVTQDWCICGSLNRIVDANQNVTTWERDLQGRITKEIRADGAAWEYLYESRTSRLKERKDAKLQVTRYEYFTDDNPKQITYVSPLIPTPNVSYTYDTVYNRVATTVDGTGTTVYSYNPVSVPPTLGAARLASIDGPLNNDTVSYTYDELSRILNRGLPVTTTRFIYDALGRVVRQENPGTPVGEFISTYEGPTERLSSFQYPNGQLTEYTYFSNSGDHRLQEIKHLAPGGGVISKHNYSYDPVSNITAWTQQTGANPAQVYELGYDRADQLTSATLKTTAIPPATLKRYAYRYDPAGNRTSNQTDNSVLAAAHNSRNQLVSTQAGGALMFRGTVNEPATVTVQTQQADVTADNRFAGTAPTTSGTNTVTVTARDFSQPPNVRTNTYEVNVSGSSVTYTYDPNGNMTSDGIRTFEWDAENRLTAVRQGAITLATFAYDSLGRRSFKTAAGVTRTYIYDGDNVTVERISSGGRVRYVHGRGIDQPLAHHDDALAVTYYLADHLGSILHLTNAAGAIVLTREYDAWGTQIQGSTTSGYAFTGREWDSETSRYYYRARYYDPESGRFSSEDPMSLVRAFAMGNGTNLYSYVGSNPSNYGDAFGLARTPCLPSPLPSLPPPPAPKRCPLIFCRVMGRQSGQYYSCTLVMIGTNCKLALRPEPCSLYMHVPLCMPDMLSVQPKPYDPDSLDPPPSPPYPQPLEFKCETCPA